MVLTNGINHVALLTQDIDRFIQFYARIFDATVAVDIDEGDARHALVDLGNGFYLHPFQLADSNPYSAGSPDMFRRGHLDHFGIDVGDENTFQELRRRLVAAGASDGAVVDFGISRNVWFADPDGHGCEIVIAVEGGQILRFDERVVEEFSGGQSDG